MKSTILTIAGVLGSAISWLFGGWTSAMTTLLIFMAIDYLTGLAVAGIFKKSPKSESGALDSKVGFKGLAKKGLVLALVVVAYRLDLVTGSTYIKDAVCIAFIVNELVSITENAGLMGVPIPKTIKKAIDLLHDKDKEEPQD